MRSAIFLLLAAFAWLLISVRSVPDTGSGIGGTSSVAEWQIVTKQNFSSQIRIHPHVLLLITVPWCGESRSLMRKLAKVVTDIQELSNLKLMVIYRNSEKMLADVLGASDGITLLYYHHSRSYKYQGQLRMQSILSSVYHIMSLQIDELPLKSLHTKEDLDNFLQSTDKAVLLLEFCGWSDRLLDRKNNGDEETNSSVQGSPEKGFLDENRTREGGQLGINLLEAQKGMTIEEVTSGSQNGLYDSNWFDRFTWANQNSSQGKEDRNASLEMLCSEDEFRQFSSFFSNFTRTAREYFLPPERQRFGLISERSLLPFLGLNNPETWSVSLQFSGCPDCSIVLQEGDDLGMILQTHNPLVKELHVYGSSLGSTIPANRPSLILFTDRSSDSLKVREESEFALQVLRKYARDNSLYYNWGLKGTQSSSKEVPLKPQSHIISDQSGHPTIDSLAHKVLKINDNMNIMIVNEGGSIGETQGNIYDILAQLLQRKKPALGAGEKKISSVAKEAGFQLLSDDFEVQITENPSLMESDPSNNIDSTVTSLEDQTFQVFEEANVNHVVNKDILVDARLTAASDNEKQSELTDVVTYLEQNQDRNTFAEGATTEQRSKIEDGPLTSTHVNEQVENCNQEDSQSLTSSADNSFDLEKEFPTNEGSTEKDSLDQANSRLREVTQKPVHVSLQETLVGGPEDDLMKSIKTSRLDEWHFQHLPFKGSLFFCDGCYQLLQSLTGGTKVPSLVALDPDLQQHYAFSEEKDISYISLVRFVEKFQNGSLTPFRRSALPSVRSRGAPSPPFVNLDFHEVDSVPRVTVDTFCELVLGYKPCQMGYDIQLSHISSFMPTWKEDVLVIFSTPSCGICQRVELIAREVYRAFENLKAQIKRNSKSAETMHIEDETQDTGSNGLPSVYIMDCMLNDCGSLLKPIGKEVYPTLMLFPAENKSAITYGGVISVVDIIEFLASHGRNSHYLVRQKGILWTNSWVRTKKHVTSYASSADPEQAVSAEKNSNELIKTLKVDNLPPISSHSSSFPPLHSDEIVVGSVLSATDKLVNAVPFDNSTILIVVADKIQGFQGVIMNKKISWDIFGELDKDLEPLKQAPLSYGGPVRNHGLPLVSLAQKATEGYVKISENIYYGNPSATSRKIEGIKSGVESAYDYWFFLGHSNWHWNQLFDELAEGAWYLNEPLVGHLDWPDR